MFVLPSVSQVYYLGPMEALAVLDKPICDTARLPDRILPHNQEAEQGLLGTLLFKNQPLETIIDFLKAEHFFIPVHQRIYEAICTMVDSGKQASPVTLKNHFEKDGDLSEVGGASYLADLAVSSVSCANVKDYAKLIYSLHVRRELISTGEALANAAYDQTFEQSPIDLIENVEAKLYRIAETGEPQKGVVTLQDSMAVAIQLAEKAYTSESQVTGVTSGLTGIDRKLGGFQDSDLIILAGRPSMGKTALATNIAVNAAKTFAESGGEQGAIVAFFSLEMSSDQLAARILADKSGVPADHIRRGVLEKQDFQNFVSASQALNQLPLLIDDTGALNICSLRSRARRIKRQHGLGLLIVDYLQLLSGTGSRQSLNNRTNEVSEITRGLKMMAKELGVPVIALSQLSRQLEQRDDKRPLLSDLRDSGSIEQDADVVMFIHREEYYLSRAEPQKGTDNHRRWQESMDDSRNIAECIIAKQRHGPIGTVKMHFDSNHTRFTDLER